jgi:polyisoprenoid-binding protein YceI
MHFLKSVFVVLLFTVFAVNVEASNPLKVDSKSSTLVWTGKKVVGGSHTGTLQLSNGELNIEKGKLTGGSFDIDMNSITCTDLTDESYNKKLVGHLKSDDFFSVEKFSKSNFVITKATPVKGFDHNYLITGKLTIKGITEEVTFPALVKIDKNNASATADIVVDRSKYNVRYGSGKFFDNLGDNMISDEFILNVKLVTKN